MRTPTIVVLAPNFENRPEMRLRDRNEQVVAEEVGRDANQCQPDGTLYSLSHQVMGPAMSGRSAHRESGSSQEIRRNGGNCYGVGCPDRYDIWARRAVVRIEPGRRPGGSWSNSTI